MYLNCLSSTTHNVSKKLKALPEVAQFYLAGGTALALQLGHRESEDLDFFSQNKFNPESMLSDLISIGKVESTYISAGSLNTYLDGVKLQFLPYAYSLLKPFVPWDTFSLASLEDIACMKLIALSDRGSKKDFIDLYVMMDTFSLRDMLQLLKKKYTDVHYNETHILKSMVYFEDADGQPMPKMHKQIEWQNVKDRMKREVKTLGIADR